MGRRVCVLAAVVVFVVVCCAGSALGAVVYVLYSSPYNGPGYDWNHAYHTVTAGLNAAKPGDEIWVAGMETHPYTERITLKNGVALYGGFLGMIEYSRDQRNWRTHRTAINGNGGGSVVTSPPGATHTTVIDGFVIQGGTGTAVKVDYGGFTIDEYYGGGIYCANSSPTIANNTIRANNADYGGGICCRDSSPAISNNAIAANYAYAGGGIYCSNSSPAISNNTMIANVGYDGGGVYCTDSSPTIINNTIAGNSSGSHGGAIYCSDSSPVISNNIAAFNSSGIYKDSAPGTPALNNNCVYNPEGYDYSGLGAGPTDIQADPKFEAIGYGQVHIQPDSPCKDAGDDTAVQAGWVDMDGQARIQGAHVDIGVDESDGTTWTYTPSPLVIHVSSAGNDANSGTSWTSAKRTIQAGIDAAGLRGLEVWVAAGTLQRASDLASLYIRIWRLCRQREFARR